MSTLRKLLITEAHPLSEKKKKLHGTLSKMFRTPATEEEEFL